MNIDPGPHRGVIYYGDDVGAAEQRGETLVRLQAAEAAELATVRQAERLQRLEELRARPGRSKAAKRRRHGR